MKRRLSTQILNGLQTPQPDPDPVLTHSPSLPILILKPCSPVSSRRTVPDSLAALNLHP